MNKDTLYTQYGISAMIETNQGPLKIFRDGIHSYISVETEEEELNLQERYHMAVHLRGKGEKGILIPVPNKQQGLKTEVNGKHFILFIKEAGGQVPGELGRNLAIFHYRGRSIPQRIEHCSRIGKWKDMWEQRINQLEKVWREKLTATPQNEFEKMFIDAFPYFSGLTDNAIQYLVDTELDDNPEMVDGGTVCYTRFTHHTWGKGGVEKNPLDWVFDHAGRDIAEWVRAYYLEHPTMFHEGIRHFFRQYQSVTPLTSFSLRMVYSRLLLPVQFFETIEMYYVSMLESQRTTLEDNLAQMIKQANVYEGLLFDFYELAGIPKGNQKLPLPAWIKSQPLIR